MESDDKKRAVEIAQQSERGAELVTKIIQFAAQSEPTLPMAILGNSALAAAVGLWREGGLTDEQVSKVLRNLATGYDSGAFTPPGDS